MDFKSILNSLSTISEGETKETEKGRVHKGEYGNKYGKEDVRDQYGHKVGKKDKGEEAKKEAPKKGRGRPKKDTGDAGVKFDTGSLSSVMGGKKPKKEVGKVSKKHSLKEYIEELETNKSQLDEAEQVTIAPAQSNTQVIKQGNRVLGQVTNPQLAAQIKQSIGKGEMTLAGDQITDEGMLDTAKKVGGAILNKLGHGSDEDLIKDLQRKAGMPPTGKLPMAVPNKPEQQKEVEEATGDYSAKKARAGKDIGKPGKQFGKIAADAAKRYGSKERGEKVAGAVLAKLRGKTNEEALDQPATMEGAPEVIRKHGGPIEEKAPPGAKAERMVKHIKQSYAKDGKITPKEKSIAYATAWKAHNKGKVEESFEYEGMILTEGAMKDLVLRFIEDLENGPRGYNIMTAVELKDRALAGRVIDKLLAHGDRYKRLAGTLKSQLRDAALEEFGFVNYEESLEEADTRPDPEPVAPISSKDRFRTTGMDSKVGDPSAFKPSRIQDPGAPVKDPTPWSRDPINAFTDRAINKGAELGKKASNFIAGLRKPKLESTDMKDIQLEGWEKQLNSLLTEGITVSSSTGQQGSPDSVSVTASDADAQALLGVLRNAGIGMFGGDEKPEVGYGVMSPGEEEPTGTGTEPQAAPDVVGDGDDMLALIKKMSGIDMGGSEDYADEEGEEEEPHTLEPADSDEEESDDEGDKEEKTDEGNAFTGALAKAKSDGVQPGEKMKVGGKEYPVKEDDVEEGNKFTGNLAKARAAGKKEADLDGDGDMEKVREGEEMCNECGGAMYEGHMCGEEHMEESYANEAGKDGTAEAELAKLKALLSMGNDLHKMKRDQTVLNPTQVTVRESINEWKRLSGIK